MTLRHRWLLPLLAALTLAGCSQEPGDSEAAEPAPGKLVSSDKPRSSGQDVPTGEIAELTAGSADLGADLYRKVAQPGENLLLSPFSISKALAMMYAGARGSSEEQMRLTLHFTLSQERLHASMNALDLALSAHTKPKEGEKAPPELRSVNASWGQEGLTFDPAYLDVLASYYGTGMHMVDFKNESSAIRSQINEWVEGQTNRRIQDLVPPDAVTADTRLLLVNALYFKSGWKFPFDDKRTQSAPFQLMEGGDQPVSMMRGDATLLHTQGDGFDAVGIPYAGGEFRMLVIVPSSGRFTEIESRLSAAFLNEVRGSLEPRLMSLGLPKFQFDQAFSLSQVLKDLGMVAPFGNDADLSGVTSAARLRISHVEHKAFMAVNEWGTEAAAATAVGAVDVSLPEPFIVDRPFLFLIEDIQTRAVLFMGRVVKP